MSQNSNTRQRTGQTDASEEQPEQPGENAFSRPNFPSSLYDSRREHDACGVGFVARLDAFASHAVVDDALAALGRMAHRGGGSFGTESADGAGILLPLPQALMRRVWRPLCGEPPALHGLGHFFLPADDNARRSMEKLIESTVTEQGLRVLAWRDTPVRPEVLPEQARASMPVIRQLLVGGSERESGRPDPGTDFERFLYVVRRRIERAVAEAFPAGRTGFHIASFSSRSVVYKGMLPGAKLAAFYPDLADRDCAAHFAVFHERYSTNTRPAWRLAQPFHCLAHNGEINTLACNQAAMRMREPLLASPLFGDDARYLRPVLDADGSDSAMLDNAFELLVRGGRSPAHAAMMLLPEPFGQTFVMGEDKRAFYEFHAALMEPWDGPAALVFTDGSRQVGAMLDRNALRPCRYAVTTDGLFVLASESGVLDLPPARIARRGRLQPRRMLMIDFARHRVITDAECKNSVIYAKPYRHWVRERGLTLRDLPLPAGACPPAARNNGKGRKRESGQKAAQEELLRQLHLYGFSREDVSDILAPMAKNAQEPVASMGRDTPLAVLSQQPQLLFSYLKQRFAQVTNPPIDPLREGLVMTLTAFAGRRGNLLEENPEHYALLRLPNPVLHAEDMERLKASCDPRAHAAVIPMLFALPEPAAPVSAREAGASLERALDTLCGEAEKALDSGATLLLLSDAGADERRAPVPSLLATSALHHYLLRKERRHACSLLVDTGEAREVMHLAQLIAFGASAVHPRTAFALIESMAEAGELGEGVSAAGAKAAYTTALQKGLLKTLSRMGISTLRSFLGGQGFEALGLGRKLVDRYFTGLPSRIGGIGLPEIALDACLRHESAYPVADARPDDSPGRARPGEAVKSSMLLRDEGRYRHRSGGERHLWSPKAIRSLHAAVRDNDAAAYRAYAEESDNQLGRPVTPRGLLQFAPANPIPLDQVEPEAALLRRFVGAAMSLGAISPEAHEAIAIACNRVGARSNCGEGGEADERLLPLPDGDSSRSRVRQIASGRFGVTAAYLVRADEIQIKMAQGAKPGEGGQLPAHKVLPEIARLRHTIPGVTLISPPPHHDIYSIEDLAQLIYDLKRLHPEGRVSVKLVAGTNVGTVANGVAKAGADAILISGHDGGTGASPRSAIDHVGLPWEIGLAETQAALVASGLRSHVILQADGQLRTGRDLAMAALLGADEFGLGTILLAALGCCLLRVCHLGTCTVGVACQDPKLRARFAGSPEHAERLLRFLAADLRQHMASLGFHSLDDMRGRADLLRPALLPRPDELSAEGRRTSALAPEDWLNKVAGLDLSPLLVRTRPESGGDSPGTLDWASLDADRRVLPPESRLDRDMLAAIMPGLRAGRPVRFENAVHNTDRSVGTRLSGEIARLHGEAGLPPGSVDIAMHGTAGQSAGAFLARGISLTITGDANDYVGKGLSGGVIAIRPADRARGQALTPYDSLAFADDQALVGNVALYGATSGELFVAGSAGERFAVRNSGAVAVVEGVGDHACEYMTGGVVVVLGSTGYNFAAGMSGGAAFVLDRAEMFQTRCNLDGVDLESVWLPQDAQILRSLLTRHIRLTGSPLAASVLESWNASMPLFLKVTPIEYRHALARMKQSESAQAESVAATEEVFHP